MTNKLNNLGFYGSNVAFYWCKWLLDPDFEYVHKYWKSYYGDNNYMEHKNSNPSVGISSKSHFRIVFTSRILPRQPEGIFIHSTINMKSAMKSGTIHLHYIRDWLHWYLLKCQPQSINKPIYLSKATSHYGAFNVHPPRAGESAIRASWPKR